MFRSAHLWVVLLCLFWAAVRPAHGEERPDVAAELSRLRQRLEAQERKIRKQQQELDSQRTRIESMASGPSELDEEVERYLDTVSEDGVALRYGSGTSLVSIHGFLNVEFLDDPAKHSDIDLHHAFLFFQAPVGEVAEAWIEVEYEHASEVIHINQAEMRLSPFDFDLTLAAGRIYAPVGIERRTWYPSVNLLVSRPLAFRQVVPGSWYATGVRADWKHDLTGQFELRVEAAVTDGLGASAASDVRGARQFRDGNNNKAVSAHVALTWRDIISFGVSGATQKYAADDSISFLAVDLEGRWRGFLFRAEYVHSSVEDPTGPVGDFDRRGGYLLASRRLLEKSESFLDLVLRFDWIDPNSKVADGNDLNAFSLGLRWSPASHFTLKGELQRFDARHGADPARDWALLVQAVLDF